MEAADGHGSYGGRLTPPRPEVRPIPAPTFNSMNLNESGNWGEGSQMMSVGAWPGSACMLSYGA